MNLLGILGFFPKITGVLSLMPMPVMGAILIFVTCFMIISGIQIILGGGGGCCEFRFDTP